jgi:hypothetical protein
VDREYRIEQVRQLDPMRLGDESERGAVAVEAPGPALFRDRETRLVGSVEEGVVYAARGVLIR